MLPRQALLEKFESALRSKLPGVTVSTFIVTGADVDNDTAIDKAAHRHLDVLFGLSLKKLAIEYSYACGITLERYRTGNRYRGPIVIRNEARLKP